MAKVESIKAVRRLNYRGMAHLDADYRYPHDYEDLLPQLDQVLQTVYSPMLATGMPSTDFALQSLSSLDPVTREYVRSKLQAPNPQADIGHADADVAMSMSRRYGESVGAYVERLKEAVDSHCKDVSARHEARRSKEV